MLALTKVEQAILDVLATYPDEKISGRELRGRLSNRGFQRSAPALVFTMMNLADKGLVSCREEANVIDGVEVRQRFYRHYGSFMSFFIALALIVPGRNGQLVPGDHTHQVTSTDMGLTIHYELQAATRSPATHAELGL